MIPRPSRVMARRLFVVGLAAVGLAAAQVPEPVPGEVVVLPFSSATPVLVDGDLADWGDIVTTITNDGPQPSADPAVNGELRWRVAADPQALYFAATISDATIVAGQNGANYWNEDSIELYLNFSGDEFATSYGPGIAQITFSAVDIGNTDPSMLTLSGNGAENLSVTGFVFETPDGWGLEVAIGLDGVFEVATGEDFGFQVQANGSSGGDRDLKLSWSAADVSDTSFQDPSVFGKAIAFDASSIDEVVEVTSAAASGSDEAEIDEAGDEPVVPPTVGDATTATEPSDSDDGPDSRRALLVAAIISSATILLGGIWFEQRRKKSEERLALSVENSTDAPPGLESIFDLDDGDGHGNGSDDAHR